MLFFLYSLTCTTSFTRLSNEQNYSMWSCVELQWLLELKLLS